MDEFVDWDIVSNKGIISGFKLPFSCFGQQTRISW
jgi:hypothetical protein